MIIKITGGRRLGKTDNSIRLASQISDQVTMITTSVSYWQDKLPKFKCTSIEMLEDYILMETNRPKFKCVLVDDIIPERRLMLLLKQIEFDVLIINYYSPSNYLNIDYLYDINNIKERPCI